MSGQSSNLGRSGSGGVRVRRDGVSPAQALLRRQQALLRAQAQVQGDETRAKAKEQAEQAKKLASRQGARTPLESRGTPQIPTLVATTLREIPRIGDGTGKEKNIRLRSGPSLPAYLDPKATKAFGSGGSVQFVLVKSSSYDVSVWVPFQVYGDKVLLLQGNGRSVELPLPSTGSGNSRVTDMSPAPVAERVNQLIRQGKFNISGLGQAPDSEPMGALYVLANTSVANGKRWSAYLDALPDSPKKTALQTRLNQILRGEITGGIFSGTASVALTYEAGGPAYRLGVIQSMIDLGEGSLNMLALQPPGTIKVSDLHRERQRIIEEARKNGIDLGLKDGDANNLSNQFRTEDPETRALYDRGRSDGQAMLLGVAGGAFSLKVLLPRASLRTSSNAGTYLRLKEIEIGGRRVVVPIDSRDNIIPVRELQRRGGRQWEAYQRDIKGGAPVVPNSPTAALEFANALYGGKYSVIGLIGENNIVPFVRRGPSGGGGPSVDGGRGGGGLSTMLGQGPVRVETMSVGALEQTRGGSGLSGGVALKQLNAQLASSPELVAALPKLKPGQGFTTIVGDGSGGFFVATVTSLGVRGEVAVTLDDWERSGTLGSRPPTVRVTLSGNAGSPLSLASTQPQPLPSIGSNTRIDVADLGKTATGIRMAWALASAQQNSVTLAKLSAGEPVYFSDGGKAEPVSGGNVKFTLNTGEYYVAPYNKDTRQFTLPAAVRRLMPVPTAGGSTGQQQLEQVGTQLDDIRQDTAQVQQRLNNSVANIEQQMTQAREDFNRRSDEIQRAIAAENERLAEARARSIETAKQTEAINKQEWEATMGCLNHPLTRAARKRVTGEDTRFDPQTAQMIPGSADRKRFKNFNVVLVQTLETLFPGRRLPEIYGYLKTHPSDLKRVLDIVEAKVREQPGSVSRVQALNVSQEAVLNAGPRDVAKLRLRDAINAYASGQRGNLPGGVIAAERAPGALDFIDPGTGVWTSVKFKDNTTDAILWDPPGSTSSTLPSSATQVPRRTYAERIKALREALDIKGQDAFTQGVMKRLDEGLRASAKERDISIDQAVNAFVRDVGPNGEVQSKKAASLRLLKQVQAQLKTNPGGLDKEQVQRVQEAIGQEWVKRLNDPDAGIDFLRSMTDPAARGAFIEKHKGEPAAAVRPTTGDPANPTGLPTAPPPQTVTPANPNVVPTPVPAEVPTGAPLNPDPPAIQALPKELRERLRDYGLGTKTRDEALERLTPAQQKKLKEAMDALDKLDKAAKGAPIQSPQEIAQKGPLSEVEKIRWLRKMQSAAEAQTISDYRSGKKTREEALKGLKGKSRARVAEAIDAIDRTKLAWGPGGGVAVPEYKPLALAAAINSSVKDNHYGYLNLDAGTIEAMKRSLENALKENPSPESKKSLERALATLNDQPAAAQRYNQGLDDFARALDREGVRSLPENLQPLVRDALHERLSSGKLDAATQRTYTRVIAALDAEIKGQGAAPARTAGEISAAQRQREKLLSEATEAVGATRRALNEASAAKKDIPTQVKKYGEAAEHIKKLQALETLARGQGEKQIADAIAVLHKALESERKAGFSTGPGAAQANANRKGPPFSDETLAALRAEIDKETNANLTPAQVVIYRKKLFELVLAEFGPLKNFGEDVRTPTDMINAFDRFKSVKRKNWSDLRDQALRFAKDPANAASASESQPASPQVRPENQPQAPATSVPANLPKLTPEQERVFSPSYWANTDPSRLAPADWAREQEKIRDATNAKLKSLGLETNPGTPSAINDPSTAERALGALVEVSALRRSSPAAKKNAYLLNLELTLVYQLASLVPQTTRAPITTTGQLLKTFQNGANGSGRLLNSSQWRVAQSLAKSTIREWEALVTNYVQEAVNAKGQLGVQPQGAEFLVAWTPAIAPTVVLELAYRWYGMAESRQSLAPGSFSLPPLPGSGRVTDYGPNNNMPPIHEAHNLWLGGPFNRYEYVSAYQFQNMPASGRYLTLADILSPSGQDFYFALAGTGIQHLSALESGLSRGRKVLGQGDQVFFEPLYNLQGDADAPGYSAYKQLVNSGLLSPAHPGFATVRNFFKSFEGRNVSDAELRELNAEYKRTILPILRDMNVMTVRDQTIMMNRALAARWMTDSSPNAPITDPKKLAEVQRLRPPGLVQMTEAQVADMYRKRGCTITPDGQIVFPGLKAVPGKVIPTGSPAAAQSVNPSTLPPYRVVIVDSSDGGIIAWATVQKQIEARLGRPVQIIVIGDHRYAPYGPIEAGRLPGVVNNLLKVADQLSPDTIFIACNTACTALPRGAGNGVTAPLVDIVSYTAGYIAQDGGTNPAIFATRATVDSHAYRDGVRAINPNVNVAEVATPELATLVNEGAHNNPARAAEVRAAVKRYVGQLDPKTTSVWLCCTHYPQLERFIREALDARGMRNTRVIDPMPRIAAQVGDDLLKRQNRNEAGRGVTGVPPLVLTSGRSPQGGLENPVDVRASADLYKPANSRPRVIYMTEFGPEISPLVIQAANTPDPSATPATKPSGAVPSGPQKKALISAVLQQLGNPFGLTATENGVAVEIRPGRNFIAQRNAYEAMVKKHGAANVEKYFGDFLLGGTELLYRNSAKLSLKEIGTLMTISAGLPGTTGHDVQHAFGFFSGALTNRQTGASTSTFHEVLLDAAMTRPLLEERSGELVPWDRLSVSKSGDRWILNMSDGDAALIKARFDQYYDNGSFIAQVKDSYAELIKGIARNILRRGEGTPEQNAARLVETLKQNGMLPQEPGSAIEQRVYEMTKQILTGARTVDAENRFLQQLGDVVGDGLIAEFQNLPRSVVYDKFVRMIGLIVALNALAPEQFSYRSIKERTHVLSFGSLDFPGSGGEDLSKIMQVIQQCRVKLIGAPAQ
jgi:glutamate racemase